jgi:hypothetical protein
MNRRSRVVPCILTLTLGAANAAWGQHSAAGRPSSQSFYDHVATLTNACLLDSLVRMIRPDWVALRYGGRIDSLQVMLHSGDDCTSRPYPSYLTLTIDSARGTADSLDVFVQLTHSQDCGDMPGRAATPCRISAENAVLDTWIWQRDRWLFVRRRELRGQTVTINGQPALPPIP